MRYAIKNLDSGKVMSSYGTFANAGEAWMFLYDLFSNYSKKRVILMFDVVVDNQ